MLFPTATFAIFFMIVLPVSWALQRHRRAWMGWILLASYVFYGWWDWRFVFLLMASTVVNHVLALAIYRSTTVAARKGFLTLAVGFDVGLLAYFKYSGFLVSSVDNVVGTSWLVNAALPIGISFYTFMAISYVVDTYRGEVVPASFARFAVFQAFFPHLVAGPIVRASELMPQLESPRDPRRVDNSRAFFLIVSGLFLKVVIANHLATHIVDEVFAAPNRYSSLEVLVAIYAYAVQIFADFCGYTNIAIGVALLLGFKFPQNFNSPYTAVSLQDFWRRWHMTLSRWLRDYLYIPLGGSRKGRVADVREPDDHDAPRRALARSRVDVRRLGRHPRRRAVHRACDRLAADVHCRDLVREDPHVPDRLLRLGVLPRRLVRARVGDPPASVRRLGSTVAARHHLRRARDRVRDRRAVRATERARVGRASIRASCDGGAGRVPGRLPDGDRRPRPPGRGPLHLLPVLR